VLAVVGVEEPADDLRRAWVVADEGKGFDWRTVKDTTSDENLLELHGRGIMMARLSTSELTYNEAGNEVRFSVPFPAGLARLTPGLFHDTDAITFGAGEAVFNQGEPSNFLYYIISGEYDVLVDGASVSYLDPDDLFMGEMSFLLDNHRTATVKARTTGKLMRISKKDFVAAIKKKPHYALFLARLLAQRVRRANRKSAQ
jgi:hypothetical protein